MDNCKNCNCDECNECSVLRIILCIIGALVVIAGIAYAVYRFCTPDYMEDFDDIDIDAEEDAKIEEDEEDIFEEK